jgi:phospholipid/cholesterol/gamma-HCH transport system substrate-binding protein
MRKRKGSELAVGALVLGTLALALWGYFWLTGQPIGGRGSRVVLRLPDAAGLQRGDRVVIAGVKVGSVHRIRLRGGGDVVAELNLDAPVRLPADSRAELRAQGLFGNRYVELLPGRSALVVQDGDTLGGEGVATLAETAAALGERASEVVAAARDVLSPATVGALHHSARSLARALDEFAALNRSLRGSADAVASTLDRARLDRTAAGLAATAEGLAAAAANLRAATGALASVLGKIDAGVGTVGRAVNDRALYEALLTAVGRFDSTARRAAGLLEDIRANPRRYVKISVF